MHACISIPVNKLELLAPYIGLTLLLVAAVVTLVYVKKKKRRGSMHVGAHASDKPGALKENHHFLSDVNVDVRSALLLGYI